MYAYNTLLHSLAPSIIVLIIVDIRTDARQTHVQYFLALRWLEQNCPKVFWKFPYSKQNK